MVAFSDSLFSFRSSRFFGYNGIKCNKFKITLTICCLSIIALLIIGLLVFQIEINAYYPLNYLSDIYVHHDFQGLPTCSWDPNNSYSLMLLKTKLRVQYDAGQWFHMTENFLVHQPRLAQRGELLNGTRIIYLFDEDDFEKKLNEYTKFIILLSTLEDPETSREVRFLSSSEVAKAIATHSSRSHGYMVSLGNGKHVCTRIHGSIGGEVVQRSQWFQSPEEIISLRGRMTRFCQSQKFSIPKKVKKYRLTIYQRDHSRIIANEEEMLINLLEVFATSEWEINLLRHSNQRSTCDLIASLATTDLLVTPHGFQSISLLFLPIPALLFEIFPYYYYKQVYKHIATSIGLVYDHTFSQPSSYWYSILLAWIPYRRCAKSILCRTIVRGQNVIFEPKHAIQLQEFFIRYQGLLQSLPNYSYSSVSLIPTNHLLFQPSQRQFLYLFPMNHN